MNRRRFMRISGASLGGFLMAGLAYGLYRPSDPLARFRKSTKKILAERFGNLRAAEIVMDIQAEHARMIPDVPHIGGKQNLFTEWLDYGVYYLAVYHVLKMVGYSVEQAGEVIYRTYEAMADYPKWFLTIVGKLKYGKSYVSRLRTGAEKSQRREYSGNWVCTFVDGDGRAFDYGLDISECGIDKFYAAHNARELTPYMCLSDFVISKAFDRGLVRFHTIAEGSDQCDFRYKEGRETFVYPLRNGWPPQFLT